MRISRERKPKGSRRALPLVGAIGSGGAAFWLALPAPEGGRGVRWGGRVVSVAPKPAMFRLTEGRRGRVARRSGGRILACAPTERGLVEGARPIRFSPSCSTDPSEIMLRVESWMDAARTSGGVENAEHFRAGAAALLRGTFLASANHPERPGDFRLVRRWLSSRNVAEAVSILRRLKSG